MYEVFETSTLIIEKFHLSSKKIAINFLFQSEFVDYNHYRELSSKINFDIKDFFESDLPSYIALASNEPDVLDKFHSDAVKNSITEINKKLDQQFEKSTNSFAQRKDVIERIFYIFDNSNIKSVLQIIDYADILRDILNHPAAPNTKDGIRPRPLMKGEAKKYDFSSQAASNIFIGALALRQNIKGELSTINFLFVDDIEDDIILRTQSASSGYVYPRRNFRFVTQEIEQIKNELTSINEELASRSTPLRPKIIRDRALSYAIPMSSDHERSGCNNGGMVVYDTHNSSIKYH